MALRDQIRADSPYAFWPLNEETGTTANDRRPGLDPNLGIDPRNASYVVGAGAVGQPGPGGFLAFQQGTSGTLGYARAAAQNGWSFSSSASAFPVAITLEMWVNLASLPSANRFALWANFSATSAATKEWGWRIEIDGRLSFSVYSSSAGTTGTVKHRVDTTDPVFSVTADTGRWRHLACTYTATSLILGTLDQVLVDGVSVPLTTVTANNGSNRIVAANQFMTIGALTGGTSTTTERMPALLSHLAFFRSTAAVPAARLQLHREAIRRGAIRGG